MANCVTCGKCIFDAHWGEYKCEVSKTSIRQGKIYTETDCPHYKKGTPKESKKNADYEANLQDC